MSQSIGLKKIGLGFLKGDFLKNLSMVMSGTVVAQIITLMIAPVLTRLYSAEAMGIFSLYTSIVGVLTVFAAMRYELAIVLPSDEDEAAGLFKLACWTVLGVSLATLLVVLTAGDAICEALGVPELKQWLLWIAFTVLITGWYQNLNYLSTREGRFKRLSVSQVFRSGTTSLSQLGAGAGGMASAGLIGGQLAGQSIATAVLGYQTLRTLGREKREKHGWLRLKQLARKYSEFPKYSTPQALLNALSQNMPVFLLATYYGAEIVGLYAISLRLLQLPVSLVSQSVRQVFLQQASAASADAQRVPAMFRKLTLSLAAVAIVPAVILAVFGPDIFQAVLGKEWNEAGQYARWMILWLFFLFVNPPAIVLTTVYRMQRMLLIFECALLAFRFGALYIGGKYLSALDCIALYSIVGALFNVYLILYVHRKAKTKERQYAT